MALNDRLRSQASRGLASLPQKKKPASTRTAAKISPTADRLLKKAGEGLQSRPIMAKMRGKDVSVGTKYSTSVGTEDFTAAEIADREDKIAKGEQSQENTRGAMKRVVNAGKRAAGSIKAGGEDLVRRMTQMTEPYQQQNQADVAEIQQRSGELAPNAQQRADVSMADAQRRQDSALAGFQNDTAAAIQTQRTATQANVKNERQSILDQAAANGMSPDDPAVQQQLQQVNMRASQQTGQMAMQAFQQYNQARASLKTTYDQMLVARRETADASVQRAEEQGIGGLVKAQELRLQGQQLVMGAKQAAEMERAHVGLVADQLRFSGNLKAADMLNNMEEFHVPFAGIIANALSLQQAEKDQNLGEFLAQGRIGPDSGPSSFDPLQRNAKADAQDLASRMTQKTNSTGNAAGGSSFNDPARSFSTGNAAGGSSFNDPAGQFRTNEALPNWDQAKPFSV